MLAKRTRQTRASTPEAKIQRVKVCVSCSGETIYTAFQHAGARIDVCRRNGLQLSQHPCCTMSARASSHMMQPSIAGRWRLAMYCWSSKEYSKDLKFTQNLASPLRGVFDTRLAKHSFWACIASVAADALTTLCELIIYSFPFSHHYNMSLSLRIYLQQV